MDAPLQPQLRPILPQAAEKLLPKEDALLQAPGEPVEAEDRP